MDSHKKMNSYKTTEKVKLVSYENRIYYDIGVDILYAKNEKINRGGYFHQINTHKYQIIIDENNK